MKKLLLSAFSTPVDILYFEREKNKIVSKKVSVRRARNVEFRKVKLKDLLFVFI